ncbi:DUF2254 family protein [Streptomyces sp. H39-S7]|uniref:DUF2254 family protein n=1 Tax=Streptomyces sp. H39-S7 TaxID=3004357 RepID=UPI0022AEC91B|nr:DUF2254 family protein [Streptomyces sp. H39-S7]MCZ4125881.1 DUF2254 domain-containing protein [Streptomyces sp. H39-S7]
MFHQEPTPCSPTSVCALSPAVNDPATAVQILDAVEALLRRLATATLDACSVTDDQDDVQVVLRLPTWG